LRIAKGEIAVAIGAIGPDQGDVALDRVLQHVRASLEYAHLLALGQVGAEPDRAVKRRDAGTAGADALGERALWHALELDLARHPQALEGGGLLVMPARGGAHHLAHQAGGDQLMRQRVAVRGRVDHQGQLLGGALAQSAEQDVGKTGPAEARDEHRRPIPHIGHGFAGRADALVDRHQTFPFPPAGAGPPFAPKTGRAPRPACASASR